MKNELIVTMTIEYNEDGPTVFWHVVSVNPRAGVFYLDLIHTRPLSRGTIHSQTFTRSETRHLVACIKPLPSAQLRPPTPEEVSKYRTRTT